MISSFSKRQRDRFDFDFEKHFLEGHNLNKDVLSFFILFFTFVFCLFTLAQLQMIGLFALLAFSYTLVIQPQHFVVERLLF